MSKVDYDDVAARYDRRYELHAYPGIRAAIERVLPDGTRGRVLEVGCGTGKWLGEIASAGFDVAGLDPSPAMLERASARLNGELRQGSAEALPWSEGSFDTVLFINSFHHIADGQLALREAFRVLRPGGTILSVGLDPHEGLGRWYVYDYFPESFAMDLARFPSRERRLAWYSAVGFTDVTVGVAEHLRSSSTLPQALHSGILEPSFTSQLTALSREEHAAGMKRIRDAAQTDAFLLEVDLPLFATVARKRG